MIKAFGKTITRDLAIDMIVNDFVCGIVYANNTDILEDILLYGWKGLEDWSNKDIQNHIDDLDLSNQPENIQNKFIKTDSRRGRSVSVSGD